ncbi:nucleotide exchange factor GrpE [soil metagenome]
MSNEKDNVEPVENPAVSETSFEEQATAQADAPAANDLQTKNDELKDKYVRLFADFDNYKKRVARERLELIKDAGKDVIMNLLPVLDDFERALRAAETAIDVAPVKEGMALIQSKLLKNLEQKGLKAVDPEGEPFDVEFHEAITEIPAPTEDLKGKVVDVVEKGYYLNDRIIRYAKVVVGK